MPHMHIHKFPLQRFYTTETNGGFWELGVPSSRATGISVRELDAGTGRTVHLRYEPMPGTCLYALQASLRDSEGHSLDASKAQDLPEQAKEALALEGMTPFGHKDFLAETAANGGTSPQKAMRQAAKIVRLKRLADALGIKF